MNCRQKPVEARGTDMPSQMHRPTWTDEQTRIAAEMRAAGHTRREIAAAVGKPMTAVRSHFDYLTLKENPERHQARRDAINRHCRAQNEKTGRTRGRPMFLHNPGPIMRASPEALADRDRRLSLPDRDLTATYCGDPKPGYSALERRP